MSRAISPSSAPRSRARSRPCWSVTTRRSRPATCSPPLRMPTVQAAEASIGTIDSQITWQQTKIDQVAAQQRSAAAELQRAKIVYDRYKKMIVDKVIGTQELDEATASYLKAQAAVTETAAE